MKIVIAAAAALLIGSTNGESSCQDLVDACNSEIGVQIDTSNFTEPICKSLSGDTIPILDCLLDNDIVAVCGEETIEAEIVQRITFGQAIFSNECVEECQDDCDAIANKWEEAVDIGECANAAGACFNGFPINYGPCSNVVDVLTCILGAEVYGLCNDNEPYMQTFNQHLGGGSSCSEIEDPEDKKCCEDTEIARATTINATLAEFQCEFQIEDCNKGESTSDINFNATVCNAAARQNENGILACLLSDSTKEVCEGKEHLIEEQVVQELTFGNGIFEDNCVEECEEVCRLQASLWTEAVDLGSCSKPLGTCFEDNYVNLNGVDQCDPNLKSLFECIFSTGVFGVCKDNSKYMSTFNQNAESADPENCAGIKDASEKACCEEVQRTIAELTENALKPTDNPSTTGPTTNTGSAATTFIASPVAVAAMLAATLLD